MLHLLGEECASMNFYADLIWLSHGMTNFMCGVGEEQPIIWCNFFRFVMQCSKTVHTDTRYFVVCFF